MKRRKPVPPGRVMAYVGIVAGLGVSTGMNVMHAVRVSPEWWSPWLGGAWPILLFIAVEVLTRTQWGGDAARRVAWVGVGTVALVAGIESYWNLRAMLLVAHTEPFLAYIGPLGIDGLTTVCAAALLAGRNAATEPTQDVAGPDHSTPVAAPGPAQSVTHPVSVDQSTAVAQRVSPQVRAPRTATVAQKPPVSQEAIDRVLRAIGLGQPMGKGAIVDATGLSRSTATRAVDHLVEVGQLSSVGDPRRPEYVLTQKGAVTHP